MWVPGAASTEQCHLHNINVTVHIMVLYVERLLNFTVNLFGESQLYAKNKVIHAKKGKRFYHFPYKYKNSLCLMLKFI
jgi:hypothetical protein